MEIADYLRVARRRLWILILLPLLAAGAVAGFVVHKGASYSATATVAAPGVVGAQTNGSFSGYGGANGIKAFVGNFTASATAPQILNQVSAQTKVPVSTILNGLTVTPIGTSGLMSVAYQTNQAKTAGPVARAVASDTVHFLFANQLASAEALNAQAQKQVAAAQAALDAFDKRTGPISPADAYQATQGEIRTLTAGRIQAQANGFTGTVAAFDAQIAADKQALPGLAAEARTLQQLTQNLNQATTNAAPFEQAAQQARAEFKAVDPNTVVALGPTAKQSMLPAIAKQALPAFGAGLFLAVAIVLLLEVIGRPRRQDAGRELVPVPASRALADGEPAPVLSERADGRAGLERNGASEPGVAAIPASQRPGGLGSRPESAGARRVHRVTTAPVGEPRPSQVVADPPVPRPELRPET